MHSSTLKLLRRWHHKENNMSATVLPFRTKKQENRNIKINDIGQRIKENNPSREELLEIQALLKELLYYYDEIIKFESFNQTVPAFLEKRLDSAKEELSFKYPWLKIHS